MAEPPQRRRGFLIVNLMSIPKTFQGPGNGHIYDLAQRISIIENWFNAIMRKPNMVLTFEAMELTEEEAIAMEQEQ